MVIDNGQLQVKLENHQQSSCGTLRLLKRKKDFHFKKMLEPLQLVQFLQTVNILQLLTSITIIMSKFLKLNLEISFTVIKEAQIQSLI